MKKNLLIITCLVLPLIIPINVKAQITEAEENKNAIKENTLGQHTASLAEIYKTITPAGNTRHVLH